MSVNWGGEGRGMREGMGEGEEGEEGMRGLEWERSVNGAGSLECDMRYGRKSCNWAGKRVAKEPKLNFELLIFTAGMYMPV